MKKSITKSKANHELQSTLGKIKDILAEAKDEMQAEAVEAISDAIDSLKNQTSETTENFKNLIAEKPLQAVSLAVLAGIVIGKVIL